MNKFIKILLLISLFQNGIAQEGIIPTYEYFTSESKPTRWKDKAEEIVCYTYMDETFTKVESHSEFYKVVSKRKDGTKIYEGKVARCLWTGEWIYYHPNGNVLFKAFYSKGFIQGKFVAYYTNGKIYEIGDYGNEENPNGFQLTCDPNGDTTAIITYYKGKFKKSISNSRGKIVEKMLNKSSGDYVDLFIKNKNGDVLMNGYFFNGFAVGEWNCVNEKTSELEQKTFELKDSVKVFDEISFYKSNMNLDSIKFSSNYKFPEYIGGEKQLFEHIQSLVQYPEHSRDHDLEGRIVVTFIVLESGKVGYIIPQYTGLQSELTNAAIRVVQHLDNFTPGKLDGHIVSVRYNLPIKFKLVD